MKRLQILMIGMVALLCAFTVPAQDQGIQFSHESWSEALASAKKQNKIVFVDCFTDWCGPCKWMAANVMTDPEIGRLFNDNFINLGIDMEKGEGPDIAKKYQITFYPTLLFVDGDGELVHKLIGARQIPDFLAMGQAVADGIEPLGKLQKKLASGVYDREWLYRYIVRLNEGAMYDSLAMSEFAPYMDGEELLATDSWDVFKRIYRRTDTPQFLYVRDNLPAFEDKFGKQEVNEKLAQNYSGAMWTAVNEKDFDKYLELRKGFSKLHRDNMDASLASMDLMRYRQELEPEAYHKKVAQIADKYLQDDPMVLNNLAWEFYEAVEDPKLLARAVKWAERSVQLRREYANLDTYGFILYKTGHVEKAEAVLAEAIEVAKANGEDYSQTEIDLAEWRERQK